MRPSREVHSCPGLAFGTDASLGNEAIEAPEQRTPGDGSSGDCGVFSLQLPPHDPFGMVGDKCFDKLEVAGKIHMILPKLALS